MRIPIGCALAVVVATMSDTRVATAGPEWVENDDAGSNGSNAQIVFGNGPLTKIRGRLGRRMRQRRRNGRTATDTDKAGVCRTLCARDQSRDRRGVDHGFGLLHRGSGRRRDDRSRLQYSFHQIPPRFCPQHVGLRYTLVSPRGRTA